MKHSRGSSLFTNSQLLETLDSNNEVAYTATITDIKFWFDVLNEQIFENKLTPIDKIYIRSHSDFHAVYQYYKKTHPEYPKTSLRMGKVYRNEKLFVEILGHEMVHHYQFLFRERPGHGKSFKKWVECFNKKGLRLMKVYRG